MKLPVSLQARVANLAEVALLDLRDEEPSAWIVAFYILALEATHASENL